MAPQTPVGRRERFRERSRNRSRARIYILALRSKLRHRVDKVKMASRLGGEKLLLATLRNLGKGVVKERLIVREDGTQLELVTCVELGPLLPKVQGMLCTTKGSLLGEKLAAQGIFFFKEM